MNSLSIFFTVFLKKNYFRLLEKMLLPNENARRHNKLQQNELQQSHIKKLKFNLNSSLKIPRFFYMEFHERVEMFSKIENDYVLGVEYLYVVELPF